jgi:hypothetical protein
VRVLAAVVILLAAVLLATLATAPLSDITHTLHNLTERHDS